ncbi:MAG: AraC family transcriptional regulator [Pirellulales bacterium]|nr:AraC family transcriptional regulator [Pirellulales bacterium]
MQASIQKLTAPQKASFIYHVKSSPRFNFNWHFHPEYELTLITRSQGKRFVADNICDYRDGDLVLLGPNLPHTWESAPAARGLSRHRACVIQFPKDLLGQAFVEAAELRQIKGLLRRSAHGLCFSGGSRDEAARRILALGKLSGLRRLTEFLEILELLARCRKSAVISSSGFMPSLDLANHRRIDRVCRYINSNYQRDLSQPAIAGILQMNPSSFSTFFKKTVGHTFIEYLNNLRISHACRLLIETELPILEICYQSGFNNLSNFNRRFLRAMGISPRRYRAEYDSRESVG